MTTALGLLDGRRIIITGAGRGIGKGVAIACAAQGASIALLDIDSELVQSVVQDLKLQSSARAVSLQVDISSEASVQRAFAECIEELGQIDGVVINAGVLHLEPVESMPLKDWQRVIDINLTGSFLCAREAAKLMQVNDGSSSIVFTSSLFGLRGGKENGAYSASKFGVIGLAQCLAAELGARGIRVNSVCPGQVQTEMIDKLLVDRSSLTGQSVEQIRSELLSHIPSHRMGTIEEIAQTFVFLLSEQSRYITGHSLVVDGGWQVG
ncbi:MAG: SDR family oxidoreductase [Acidimicrobiaceae bacterium]|nr:SDR family oxidoreductase [Acidimicrobiaceae bacterium]